MVDDTAVASGFRLVSTGSNVVSSSLVVVVVVVFVVVVVVVVIVGRVSSVDGSTFLWMDNSPGEGFDG